MLIQIITHASKKSLKGNRITAERWSRFLKQMGHTVSISQNLQRSKSDLMVALHANHSFTAIEQFHNSYPNKFLVVLLTGTDIHQDIHTNPNVKKSLEYANRLILLQPLGIQDIPAEFHYKVRVIPQSAKKFNGEIQKRQRTFDVCVIGHLRKVKDPFRTAYAIRNLPNNSRIHVQHIGGILDTEMEATALEEMKNNKRYSWLGKRPHGKTLKILARSQVMVLSSIMEGGPGVLSEAVVAGIPILASRISATLGLLGENYPGFFEVGDTKCLTELLLRVETDSVFLKDLRNKIHLLQDRFDPSVEKSSLEKLIKEITEEKQN